MRDGRRVGEQKLSSEIQAQSAAGGSKTEIPAAAPMRCLYCSYNLHGLPEASVCPECGMRSLPQAMRQAVWELVDSPRRLWGEMFSLWRKHPPGWWWSLHRPGDLRRCVRQLLINVTVSLLIAAGAILVADSVVLRTVSVMSWYEPTDTARAAPLGAAEYVEDRGVFGGARVNRREDFDAWIRARNEAAQRGYPVSSPGQSQHIAWTVSPISSETVLLVAGWMFFLWAAVSLVGLWTQIRTGLPSFARPPRTIMAASCLESFKLVYLAMVVALAAGAETVLRIGLYARAGGIYECLWRVLWLLVVATGVAGWIGPLRSDFTRQLIRSRAHVVRILIMYALIMPFVLLILAALPVGYIVFAMGQWR